MFCSHCHKDVEPNVHTVCMADGEATQQDCSICGQFLASSAISYSDEYIREYVLKKHSMNERADKSVVRKNRTTKSALRKGVKKCQK